MEIYIGGIVILIFLAISDLVVGVSNDAVNFLNSSIGSKVAKRNTILTIASLGILAGVTFSSGMMEVARKGIFHPKQFIMPELMVIFLAVMLTDVILLDLYNTFGLPTSTTVSIVFELLGAAVAISLIKMSHQTESVSLAKYINTGKALAIIVGILMSVVIAFAVGSVVQFFTRLVFTFDFKKLLRRYGAVWGGIAISSIVYFILIKGAKGASFITPQMLKWIKTHTELILFGSFLFFFIVLQILTLLFRINVLKIIILTGTFAIAMAFAANDLVNFIGVPLAGLNAVQVAQNSASPLTVAMGALQKSVQSNTLLLLIAGGVMVITLWTSKKSRTVTKTELDLSRQDEGAERFGSSPLARVVVRMFISMGNTGRKVLPAGLQNRMTKRFDQKHFKPISSDDGDQPSFDLVRASVNLVVASALISLATSMKLPLSTTYVTFMVAMGTSLADRAWGSESAVYRVTGVLTVIGGWFFTAFMAFTVSSIFAVTIYYWRVPGVIGILLLVILMVLRNHRVHRDRANDVKAAEIFNLKKITDPNYAISKSFEHSGLFLNEIKGAFNGSFNGLFNEDRLMLKDIRRKTKAIQKWADIIIANIFKTFRLLSRQDMETTQKYSYIIGDLQEIAESQRDIIIRSHIHINNNHKGLLKVQIEELTQIKNVVIDLLTQTSNELLKNGCADLPGIESRLKTLKATIRNCDKNQIVRIQKDLSKTRLSILFYGMMGDSQKIARHTVSLLKIFRESFPCD